MSQSQKEITKQNIQKIDEELVLSEIQQSSSSIIKQTKQTKNEKQSALTEYLSHFDIGIIDEVLQGSPNSSFLLSSEREAKSELIKFHVLNWLSSPTHSSTFTEKLNAKLVENHFILLKTDEKRTDTERIEIKVIQHMKNFEVVEYFCQLGRYAKKYTSLNSKTQSCRHYYQTVGFGSFGSVYACKLPDSDYFVIKCLKYKDSDPNSLRNHVKEFFIADLMSAVEVGPKILRKTGFDFIIFPSCMEFDMEMCSESNLSTLQKDLKQSLLEMHLLKIVHCDIKPANVMYSNIYQKNVFVDFGIAEVLNKEIWEECLTSFKGTYEFCSKKMKQLFGQKVQKLVNLFLNDLQTLELIIKRAQTQFTKSSKLNYSRKHVQLQRPYIIQQKVRYFKFLLYRAEFSPLFQQKFQVFIKQFQSIQINEYQTDILMQVQQFSYEFQENNKRQIATKLFWNSKNHYFNMNLYQWNQNMKENLKLKNNLFISLLKYQNENDQEIKDFVNNSVDHKENEYNYFVFKDKNRKQNMYYVLTRKEQIMRFNHEEYFGMVLEFVSFWKSPFKVTIKQKQTVAQVMKEVIQTSSESDNLCCQYLKQQYLPEEPFVKQKCKNLVWIYGYLLSHCMQDQFTDSKAKNLMTIAKDCVFLSFKYYRFLTDCLVKYVTYLIKSKHSALITQIVIQLGQFTYLTKNHFLIQNKQKIEEKYKCFNLPMKNIIQTIQKIFINQLIENNSYLQKVFDLFLRQVFPYQKIQLDDFQDDKLIQLDTLKDNIIESLVCRIQSQFSQNNHIKQFKYHSKALKILYYLKSYNSRKNNRLVKSNLLNTSPQALEIQSHQFNILKLMQIDGDTRYQSIKQLINCINQKVNCPQISFYFNLYQRLLFHMKQKNEQQACKIFETVFQSSFQTSLINFVNLISIIQQTLNHEGYIWSTKNWKKYLTLRYNNPVKLMQYFSVRPQKYLQELEKIIITFYRQKSNADQQLERVIENTKQMYKQQQTHILQIIFNKIINMNSLTRLVYFVVKQLLNNLLQTKIKYLQFRLIFYKKSIQLANKNLFNINLMTDILKIHQPQQLLDSENYWNVRKANDFLFNTKKVLLEVCVFIDCFVRRNRFEQLAQVLVQFSIDCNQLKSADHFIDLFISLNLLQSRYAKNKYEFIMFDAFLNVLNRIENQMFHLQNENIINQVDIFPFYLFLLLYKNISIVRPKIWTKILSKVYQLYPKYVAFYSNEVGYTVVSTIKESINKHMISYSTQYVQKMKSQRKHFILVRHTCHSLIRQGSFGQIQYHRFLKEYMKKFIKTSQNSKKLDAIRKIHQKMFKKMILNCFQSFERKYNDQMQFDRQFEKCYHQMCKEEDLHINNSNLDNKSLIGIKDQQDQYKEYQESSQYVKNIQSQTLQLRYRLLQLQEKRISELLWKQKKKLICQLSWIHKLNE